MLSGVQLSRNSSPNIIHLLLSQKQPSIVSHPNSFFNHTPTIMQQYYHIYKAMRQKQKLIVTLWRGHLNNPSNYHSVSTRLSYNGQEETSRQIDASKSLTWKQTFVFPLARYTTPLKIDLININQEIKEIHFARDQILDSLAIGKCQVSVDLDNSNRGTVPAKMQIIDEDGENMGMIFLEYEILKTEVTYIVEKLMDYQYMLKMFGFKITFTRALRTVPSFYLKFLYGEKVHKQDFSFQEFDGVYVYNYPIKLYMKSQPEIQIDLQTKGNYNKDYRNPNTSFDTESVMSNSVSIKKGNIKKNQPIDLRSVDKIISIVDLNFKEDCLIHKKLPLNISVKGMLRQIGSLQFDLEVTYKTKKQKEELRIQKKRQFQLKRGISPDQLKKEKKKEKKYEPPKNGNIIINSIIARLQVDSETIHEKNAFIELKLGKIIQISATLDNPGNEIIWMDTFTFKRTWEQLIKFTIYLQKDELKVPKFYTQVNLRDLFESGRYMAKKLEMKDEKNLFCGTLIVDLEYKQEQEKPKPAQPKKIEPEISPQEKQRIAKQLKKKQIIERMQKRKQEKQKRKSDFQSSIPMFSEKQLLLPPLRSSRNSSDKNTLSPNKSKTSNSYIYNNNGGIFVAKSARFDYQDKQYSADSYFYKGESDFEKKNRGASIGYGQKYDFTKQHQKNPGIGRYEIPSVWDKYK